MLVQKKITEIFNFGSPFEQYMTFGKQMTEYLDYFRNKHVIGHKNRYMYTLKIYYSKDLWVDMYYHRRSNNDYYFGNHRIAGSNVEETNILMPRTVKFVLLYEEETMGPNEEIISNCHLYFEPIREQKSLNKIKKVIFHEPAVIVYWSDKTKTVVKVREGDEWDPEKGLAMAIIKKTMGLKEFYKKLNNKEEEKN